MEGLSRFFWVIVVCFVKYVALLAILLCELFRLFGIRTISDCIGDFALDIEEVAAELGKKYIYDPGEDNYEQ